MTMSLTIETPAHHAVRGYLVETLQVSLPPGGEQIWGSGPLDEPVREARAFRRRRAPVAVLGDFPGRV